MADLVQDRHLDLLAQGVLVGEAGEQVGVEEDDAGRRVVGGVAVLTEVALALEQAERARVEALAHERLVRAGLEHDRDVLQALAELLGDLGEHVLGDAGDEALVLAGADAVAEVGLDVEAADLEVLGDHRLLLAEQAEDLAERVAGVGELRGQLDGAAVVRLGGLGSVQRPLELAAGEQQLGVVGPGRLGVDEAVGLGVAVADALGWAHARGIVHRDVKPANLLLAAGDPRDPRLLDFGIARLRGHRSLTRTGAAIGSPGYMAPEQAQGALDLDERADVFSLGCVLYACLTGVPAFSGEHVAAVIGKLLAWDPPPVQRLAPGVSRALSGFVESMLAKDRDRRPAGAAARAAASLARSMLATCDCGVALAVGPGVAAAAVLAAGVRVSTGTAAAGSDAAEVALPVWTPATTEAFAIGGDPVLVADEVERSSIAELLRVRFRTLGCYPLTGAIESNADTLPKIIEEMLRSRDSERQGRMIDYDESGSMEQKKREGYF